MIPRLKRFIQSVVGLSSSEAGAFLILVPLIFLIIFSEPLYRWLSSKNEPFDIKQRIIYDSISNELVKAKLVTDSAESVKLFSFNPNTATEDKLKSLGFSERVAKRILQYRNKGGQFKIKKDLAKIYGMDSSLYKTLVPYIDLPDKIESVFQPTEKSKETTIEYNLNLTDTVSLKSINGVGSVLARRVVKYRESLGGFISENQLKEIYGLDSLTIQRMDKFFVEPLFSPRKINVNTATEQELDNHPYISLREAKAIVTYRLQHGKFTSLSDIQKIKLLRETTVNKIAPYISFE